MCRGRIVRGALFFATLGLVAELSILLPLGAGSRLDFLPHVALSAVGLYLASGLLGLAAANYLCPRPDCHKTELVGVGVAWLSLLTQALFGSSLEFIREFGKSYAFESYLLGPVVSVVAVGTIPAILIGLAYAWRVRKILARQQSESAVTER